MRESETRKRLCYKRKRAVRKRNTCVEATSEYEDENKALKKREIIFKNLKPELEEGRQPLLDVGLVLQFLHASMGKMWLPYVK